jgi:tryptophan-rich sensory protein
MSAATDTAAVPASPPSPTELPARKPAGLLALAGCILLSMAGATAGIFWRVDEWYFELNRPSFAPPNWLFGPVWTLLYVLIGVSLWRALRSEGLRRDPRTVPLFASHWILNFLWSYLFFGLHRPGWALAEIALLVVVIAALTRHFGRHDPLAAWLLAPYLAWVSFATVLNAGFWWLN